MKTASAYTMMLLFLVVSASSMAQTNRIRGQSIAHPALVIASTKNGFVRGIADSSTSAIFLGIPYAAPPKGTLRWKAPEARPRWSDTLSTVAYGCSCPQPSKENDPTNEDCLYLNIFTTKDDLGKHGAKKPVMFWIHGGGFLGGSAKGYDGRELAKKGVVVVTINYRLGALGYLYHPALETSPANKGAGNYGLLDQIAALEWVKQNIAAFGGDPSNVTVWGESAGAFSVGALLATPQANGLFHKAILQSGTGLINGIQSKTEARRYAVEGAKAAGIEGSDTNALKSLYGLTPEQLIGMFPRPQRPPLQGFYIWFSPVVEGWVLPLPLDKAIDENRWNNVPLLVGSNKHEGAYFQRVKPTGDAAEYYNLLGEGSLGDKAGILKAIYPVTDSTEILEKSQDVVGDFGFGAPARALARMATSKKGKAFLYHFTRTSRDSAGNPVKALHSTELPFVFGYTLDGWVPYKRINGVHANDAFLAAAMSDYWVSFARYGNPNGNGSAPALAKWPVYDSTTHGYLEIGEEIRSKINLRKNQYDAMDQLSKLKGELRN
ncbi:MAG TPA: carboxylesterase/lipase family protein [Flavisolibacter sp.]|nr:carboxylesterase/lipase family protein [Flavisolibacter sp.]